MTRLPHAGRLTDGEAVQPVANQPRQMVGVPWLAD
jgi:hypothetical protein